MNPITRLLMRPKKRPELEEAIRQAAEQFDRLSPEQQAEHREEQRRSWVIGEMMLGDTGLTRDEAIRRYERMDIRKITRKRHLQVRLNGEGWKELRILSVAERRPLQSLMIEAINDLLAKYDRPLAARNPLPGEDRP